MFLGIILQVTRRPLYDRMTQHVCSAGVLFGQHAPDEAVLDDGDVQGTGAAASCGIVAYQPGNAGDTQGSPVVIIGLQNELGSSDQARNGCQVDEPFVEGHLKAAKLQYDQIENTDCPMH
jgi:hypothetical protein